MDAGKIHAAIAVAGIPIDWVECPTGDSFVLHFPEAATAEQRAEAEAIAAQVIQASEPPDWERLKTKLRGGPIFRKAETTTNSIAWALLLATLNSNSPPDDDGRLADFQRAITGIRAGLSSDLTTEEIATLNAVLTQFNFPFQIS